MRRLPVHALVPLESIGALFACGALMSRAISAVGGPLALVSDRTAVALPELTERRVMELVPLLSELNGSRSPRQIEMGFVKLVYHSL